MATEDANMELLLQAVVLYRAVPNAGGSKLSMVDTMKMVGVNKELAETRAFQEKMKRMLQGTPPKPFVYTDEEKISRSVLIIKTARKDSDGKCKLTKAKAMRLAGCTDEETKGNTALRARVD